VAAEVGGRGQSVQSDRRVRLPAVVPRLQRSLMNPGHALATCSLAIPFTNTVMFSYHANTAVQSLQLVSA